MRPVAVVFDAYGTLFDVASVAQACADLTPDPAGLVRRSQVPHRPDAAAAIGCSEPRIGHIETGRNAPSRASRPPEHLPRYG